MSIRSRALPTNIEQNITDTVVTMKEVSGMGIQSNQEDVSTEDLMQMIQSINKTNQSAADLMLEENQRLLEEEQRREQERLKKLEEERLLKRYEEEQKLRALKEAKEAEEEAKRLAEEEEKKNNSFLNKAKRGASSLLKKKTEENPDNIAASIIESSDENTITIQESIVQDIEIDSNDYESNILNDDIQIEDESDDFYMDESFNEIFIEPNDNDNDDDFISSTQVDSEQESVISNNTKEIDHNDVDNQITNVEEESTTPIIQTMNEVPSEKESSLKKNKKKEKKGFAGININININNPFQKKSEPVNIPNDEIEKLKFAAYNDKMTGLLNKASYEERIGNLKIKGNLTVIYFDINNLKLTNDTIGHEAGDSLITEAANQIRDKFPNDGYRTGGDEFIVITNKYKKQEILNKIDAIHAYMKELTDTNPQKIMYAVSIGYAFVENGKTFKDLCTSAEEMMYKNKTAYKDELKKKLGDKYIDPRASDKEILAASKKTETPTKTEDMSDQQYDQLLTKDQRELKQQIQLNHEPASSQSIGQIIMEIQKRHSDIEAILIASKDFNNLFILQDVNSFIRIIRQMDSNIDFTYLYVLYRGGPQYYGVDEYTSEITHLFEEISGALLKRQIRNANDLQKIKGINIFKQIYADI